MHVQITHLFKTYPNGVQALKGITLTIPNGAGKSTLMRIPATLQEPDMAGQQLREEVKP